MKVVLLCRDSLPSRRLAERVGELDYLKAVVIESGRGARRRKVGRVLRNARFWHLPARALDLFAIAL